MAFLARALNNILQNAAPANGSPRPEPKGPIAPLVEAEKKAHTAPKGPLSAALSSMKHTPSAFSLGSEIAKQGPIQKSPLKESRNFQPPVALSCLKNIAIDDQNFAFFGDLEIAPITAQKTHTIAQETPSVPVMTREHLASSAAFKKYFDRHILPGNRPLSFGIFGSTNALGFAGKKFSLQMPMQPSIIYRQPPLMIRIPLRIEQNPVGKESIKTVAFTSEPRDFDLTPSVLGVSHFITPDMLEKARSMYQLPVSTSKTADREVGSKASPWTIGNLRSWLKEIISIANTNHKTPLLSLTGNYPSAEMTLAHQSLATTFEARIQNLSLSLTVEDDTSEGEKASEDDFANAVAEMLLKSFAQNQTSSSIPTATTLFANLAGGKKVSISVSSGFLDKQMRETDRPQLRADRKTIQAIIAAESDEPSLLGRKVEVEYTGANTERRASLQTEDVVFENKHFAQRLYDKVKAAPGQVYQGSMNMASGAFGYASSKVNGALDTALHSGGIWIGQKAGVFKDGVMEGLGLQAPSKTAVLDPTSPSIPSTDSSPLSISNALKNPRQAGERLGMAIRTSTADFAQGIRNGLANPASAAAEPLQSSPIAEEPASASHLVASTLKDPKGAGEQLGRAVKQTVTSFVEGMTSAVQGQTPTAESQLSSPIAEEPASASHLVASTLKDPKGAGEQLGKTIKSTATSFAQGLSEGFHQPIISPVQQTMRGADAIEEPRDEIEALQLTGLLDRLRNDPKTLGQDIAEAATSVASQFIQGAVSGVKKSLAAPLTSEDSGEAPQVTRSVFDQLRHNPQTLGEELSSAAADTAKSFAHGLLDGARRSLLGTTATLEEIEASEGSSEPGIVSRLFETLSEAIKQGLKTRATQTLLAGMSYALNQAESSISSQGVKEQIREMIHEIEQVQAGRSSAAELRSKLTSIMNGNTDETSQDRKILEFHLDGLINVPFRETEVNGSSSKAILEDIIQQPPRSPTERPIDYKAALPIQQTRLVKNIAALSGIQIANQFFCSGALSDRVISQILKPGDEEDCCMPNIRRRFIQEVNNLSIHWIRKIAAKICFYCTSGLVSMLTKSFLENAFKKVESAVQSGAEDSPDDKHNSIFKSTNEFLCVLKGRMKHVRDTNYKTSDPETMIDKELSHPDFNHGFTAQKLYEKTIKKAVYEVLPPLGWTNKFSKQIQKLPTYAKWTLTPVTEPIRALVYVIESISNAVLRFTVQYFVKKSQVLDKVIARSTSQIGRNNYTHAINKIIFEQLNKIWLSLDEPSSDTNLDATKDKKEALKELVMSLSDVLQLNKQIRHVDANPSVIERVKNGLNNLCIDQAAEVIGLLLNKAKDTLLDPQFIHQREYSLLDALNSSLESDQITPVEDMISLENEIEKLSKSVLNTAIKKVVHNTLINIPRKIQEQFQGYVEKLKKEVALSIEKIEQTAATSPASIKEAIKECSERLLDIQKRIDSDADIESQASLLDRFYTKPLAEHLQRIFNAADAPEGQLQEEIERLKATLHTLRDVEHINSASLPAATAFIEKTSSWIALQAATELLSEAWSLARKPFVWKHGIIHRSLMGFVES